MSSHYTSENGSLNPEKKVIGFDWLISNRLGEFGKYQKIIYFLLALPAIICALHTLSWVFLGANVNYRCQLDGEDASNASYFNLPNGHFFNESFPWETNPMGKGRWSQCQNFKKFPISANPFTNFSKYERREIVGCNGKYIFDNSQYKSSARIDLICENAVWYTVAETLSKSGILVGALVFGNLSDRFGRRPVFFYALCQQVTCGIIAAIAPNYIIFVIARFLIGMAGSGVFLVAFVIALELVGKQKRVVAAMGMQCFFTLGYLILGVLAYFIREWRYLQLTLTLPGLCFLSYYWFMPDSIRWLLTNGEKGKAVKILKKISTVNKIIILESELQNLKGDNAGTGCPEKRSIGLLEILKYRRTLLRSLNIFFIWFVNCGVYYGLALNSGNLGGNDYVNFILSGAVEIPAYGFLLLTLNRWGRKKIVCGCMLSAGIFLIACGLIPDEYNWLMITLNMMGKLCNAAAYAAIYILAAEVFPTVIRNSFMGISSVSARVGGILSDYIILVQQFWKPLPHLIFGVISFTSGLLVLFLPETLGKTLPETMEDGELFGTTCYDNPSITINDDDASNYSNDLGHPED